MDEPNSHDFYTVYIIMYTKLFSYQSSNSCSAVSPFSNLSISIEASSFTSNLLHSDTLQFVKLHPVMTMFGMLLLAVLNSDKTLLLELASIRPPLDNWSFGQVFL